MADGRIVIDTSVDTKGLQTGLTNVKGMLSNVTGATSGANSSFLGLASTIGKVATGIGVATVAFTKVKKAIGECVVESSKLETALASASTLFGDADVNMKDLSASIRNLSAETGLAAETIGQSLYDALSAGVPASDDMSEALDFLRQSAHLAKAGFTDINTAMLASIKTINAYGLDVAEADRINKILIQTQNLGIMTVNDLGNNLAKVTPTAAAFGVAFEQIGASLAVMTAQGTSAEMATTQLNSLLSELGKQGQKGADNLELAAKAANLNAKSFKELQEQGYSLGEILGLMKDYAESNGQALIDMFGSLEAGKAALSIGSDINKFSDTLSQMSTTADVVGASYQKVTTTLANESQRLKTAFDNFKSTIGDFFRPVATDVTGILADMFTTLGDNRNATQLLDDAVQSLKKANEDYALVLEDVLEKEGDVSAQRVTNAYQTQIDAVKKVIDAYKTLKDEQEHGWLATTNGLDLEGILKQNEESIESFAKHFGVYAGDMKKDFNELLVLYQKGSMDKWGLFKDNTFSDSSFEFLIEDMARYEELVNGITAETTKLDEATKTAVTTIAEAYLGGNNAVLSMVVGETELFDAVMKEIEAINQANKAKAEAIEATKSTTMSLQDEKDAIKALEAQQKQAEIKAKELTEEQKAIIAVKDKEIENAEKYNQVLGEQGDETDLLAKKINAYSKCIVDLIDNGVNLENKEFKDLCQTYKDAQSALAELTKETEKTEEEKHAERIAEINSELEATITTADHMGAIMGEAFNSASVKSAAYLRAIEALINEGLTPQDDLVKKLYADYQALQTVETDNLQDQIAQIIQQTERSLSTATSMKAMFGETYDDLTVKANVLKTAIQNLLSLDGVDETNTEVQKLKGEIDEILSLLGKDEGDVMAQSMQEILDKTDKLIKDSDTLKAVLGDSYDDISVKARLYKGAIEDLISLNPELNEQSEIIMELREKLASLEAPELTIDEQAQQVWDKLNTSIEECTKLEDGLGDLYDENTNLAKVYKSAIDEILKLGITRENKALDDLIKKYEKLVDVKEEVTETVYSTADEYKELSKELQMNHNLAMVLGDSYDENANAVAIYEKAIRNMLKNGLTPASAEVKHLTLMMNSLKDTTEETTEEIKKGWLAAWGAKEAESWADFAEDSVKRSLSAMNKGVEELFKGIFNKKKELERIDGDLKKNEDDSIKMNEKLRLAQLDLAQAQQDGDEKAIKNAQALVDSYQEQVDALAQVKSRLDDEKTAVKNNEKAWKSFGKIALEALASVLEGLGSELAARAVLCAIGLNVPGAAAAGAGSAAAFIAANAVRGWANSFSQGGVVQSQNGRATTGDNTLIYANPGELILNKAQQQVLAQQLALLDRFTSSATANSSSNAPIIVQFTGTVLGDQKSISEWVYQGIEQCRHSGRL